jgi:hypothetical protein
MFPRSAADRQKVNSWKADEVFGEDDEPSTTPFFLSSTSGQMRMESG